MGEPGEDQLRGAVRVLVGRTREQETLRQELDAAASGAGRVVLVGGEAGIGKTTLARDLTRTATDLGIRVLSGSCYDLTSSPPYGPWLDLFEACRRDPTLPPPPAALADRQLASITDQATLADAVRTFFDRLSAERPAAVIFEDVHWADPASLDLLRHVGPHVQHWPLLLLLTYRSDEPGAGRPWTHHLPALVRETEGLRLDLRPLDPDALRTLVDSRYPLAPADAHRLIAWLGQHSEGNPFFATEILRTLEGTDVLRPQGDAWSLGTLDHAVVPPLLRQVIDARVIRLGDATRTHLSIASVIGHDVPLDLWQEVTDLTGSDLLDLVDRAVDAHLLEAARDGTRVRFVHALTRDALYEGILPPRRKLWHARTADALLSRLPADPDAIAYHLKEAGDHRAVEWLIQAGERAQGAYAWLTAAERFRSAVSLLDTEPGHEHAKWRLHTRTYYVLRFAYPTSAIAAMDETMRLASQAGDRFTIAETLALRGLLLCYTDHFQAGLAEMEQGMGSLEALPLAVLEASNTMRAWLSQAFTGQREGEAADDEAMLTRLQEAGVDYRRSYQAWVVAAGGRLAEARDISDRLAPILHDTGKGGGTRLASAFLRHALAILAAADGRPAGAIDLWALARRDFEDHHVLVAFTHLDELRDVALTYAIDNPAARRRAATEAAEALARASGALRPGVTPAIAWVRCLAIDGRWNEALQILGELPSPGNAFLRREYTDTRALIARHRGDTGLAWHEILPLFPQGPATAPGNLIHQEGLFLLRLAADLCLDTADLAGAIAWLTAHDRWLAWSGSRLGRAEGLLAWGRYHRAMGNLDRAREVLGEALAHGADPGQPLVRLGAHRLMGMIATTERRIGDAEAHLTSALALAITCDIPFEVALTSLALAELRLATGDEPGAAAFVDTATITLVELGAAPALRWANSLAAHLPAPRTATATTATLTDRELDVLRLVAEGRSNPEIAAALYISRETARTHVSNILRKLDVASRTEAVDHAHRHGLLARDHAASSEARTTHPA